MDLNDVQDLAERAKQRGMNPIERLDAMGLILTDKRHQQLAREVCLLLADRIDHDPLIFKDQVLKRDLSPLDVKAAIIAYIRRNFTEDSVEFPRERSKKK